MNSVLQTIFGLLFIFFCTTLGSASVFLVRKGQISERLNQITLGFAGGIMLSASVFSLIDPALETQVDYMPSYALVAIAVFMGALFLYAIDKIVPHIHAKENEEEGLPDRKLSRKTKMFLAVTIHNIPEGLAVGVAFGVALALLRNGADNASASLTSALMLAIGIGIQNIPEGAGVSFPILSETGNKKKAFLFGTLSGVVEPISGVIGFFLAYSIQAIMPWALSFAGGCMIYVIIEEMVPDMKGSHTDHYGVWAFIVGFLLMMVFDKVLA